MCVVRGSNNWKQMELFRLITLHKIDDGEIYKFMIGAVIQSKQITHI